MPTALYCSTCWRFLSYEQGRKVIRWVTCESCLQRIAGQVRVTGGQPAVCLQCRQPFDATRQAQKFCSSACRSRSWRASRESLPLAPTTKAPPGKLTTSKPEAPTRTVTRS